MIKKVYDKELKEYVETSVTNPKLLKVKISVKKYTDFELMQIERRLICEKYNVVYGKRFYNFDVKHNLTDSDFESICKFISQGNSLNKSYLMAYDLKKSWEGFEDMCS